MHQRIMPKAVRANSNHWLTFRALLWVAYRAGLSRAEAWELNGKASRVVAGAPTQSHDGQLAYGLDSGRWGAWFAPIAGGFSGELNTRRGAARAGLGN